MTQSIALPAGVGAVLDRLSDLRGKSPTSDLELAETLLAAGALIALTRVPAEHVSHLFLAFGEAWKRRALEELGMRPRRRDVAARIEALTDKLLGFAPAEEQLNG